MRTSWHQKRSHRGRPSRTHRGRTEDEVTVVGHALAALHEGALEAAKDDDARETEYRARNVPFMVKRLTKVCVCVMWHARHGRHGAYCGCVLD